MHGIGSGTVVGIVIGQRLASKFHEWFLKTFARKKSNLRRERKERKRKLK